MWEDLFKISFEGAQRKEINDEANEQQAIVSFNSGFRALTVHDFNGLASLAKK